MYRYTNDTRVGWKSNCDPVAEKYTSRAKIRKLRANYGAMSRRSPTMSSFVFVQSSARDCDNNRQYQKHYEVWVAKKGQAYPAGNFATSVTLRFKAVNDPRTARSTCIAALVIIPPRRPVGYIKYFYKRNRRVEIAKHPVDYSIELLSSTINMRFSYDYIIASPSRRSRDNQGEQEYRIGKPRRRTQATSHHISRDVYNHSSYRRSLILTEIWQTPAENIKQVHHYLTRISFAGTKLPCLVQDTSTASVWDIFFYSHGTTPPFLRNVLSVVR